MSTSFLLRLSILVGLLAISASARPGGPFHPCKTLIFFSTSSSFPQNPSLSGPRSITVFFTQIRPSVPTDIYFPDRPIFIQQQHQDNNYNNNNPSSFPLYSSVGASFRDRTKDILGVVGSLLFGVGCGALTAATMYLVWSVFAPARFSAYQNESDTDGFDDDSEDDGYDNDVMKKAGYVAIPSPVKEVAKE